MYFVVGLHGHKASFWPGCSGAPTECRHLTKSPSPKASKARAPIRVMMRMFTTTYSLSLSSTPIWEIGEPIGPMLNGITYIVRPFMQPSNNGAKVRFISLGAIQLLVGPASDFRSEQMKVRSSTRATSLGSELHAKLLGRLAGSRRLKRPRSTSKAVIRSYSSWEPSHSTTASGLQMSACSLTQAASFRFLISGMFISG